MKGRSKVLVPLLAATAMLLSTGCAMRLGDMSVLSTRNVSLDKVDLDRLPQVKGVTGKDSKVILLFIPLGIPHLEDAVDDALDKGNGDVMVDAVVHSRGWWFLIGESSLTVKGTVVNTRGTKMMRMFAKFARPVAAIALMAMLTGCVVRHGDFTVVSNKLLRLSEFELAKADRAKGVVGKDVQHIIIFIPTGGPPTIEGAMDDALEKGGGDVMTDAVIKFWSWYIPYVYGQTGWSIQGDVVKTRRN